MKSRIWVRRNVSARGNLILGGVCLLIVLALWFFVTSGKPENRIVSANVLPNPIEVLTAFPALIMGSSSAFIYNKSLLYSVQISLSRELLAFFLVLIIALPLGVFMSAFKPLRSFFWPLLVIGTFIPIAALIPLTLAMFGIGELQKIVFLALGMFFVLLGLIIKEMDEVDDIYLQTAYLLGFSQFKTLWLVNFRVALARIWKHLSSVFGLGWGYIIFAEMVNSSGGDSAGGIGWLFIARQRRLQVADMYAIFFVIILLAFLISFLFKRLGIKFFPWSKEGN